MLDKHQLYNRMSHELRRSIDAAIAEGKVTLEEVAEGTREDLLELCNYKKALLDVFWSEDFMRFVIDLLASEYRGRLPMLTIRMAYLPDFDFSGLKGVQIHLAPNSLGYEVVVPETILPKASDVYYMSELGEKMVIESSGSTIKMLYKENGCLVGKYISKKMFAKRVIQGKYVKLEKDKHTK